MRLWPCLAVLVLLLGPAHAADEPERLSDRPNPSVTLVPAPGWRLSAVARVEVENDIAVLTIEGDVFNAADSERPSPTVRFALQDGAGRDIVYWTVLTDLERIEPGAYASFRTRTETSLEGIEGMEHVVVSTVEAAAQID